MEHRFQFQQQAILALIFLLLLPSNSVIAKSNVYIVYMGEKRHEDPKIVEEAHHDVLSTVLESKTAAKDSIIHSYKHGFSGFAVKLTNLQAQTLREHSEVVHVMKSQFYKLQTTRTWDFLGLPSESPHSYNLLRTSKMGDGTIVGIIDTGIWPESKSFSDKGMAPVPSHWKGTCKTGQEFNSTNCNKKLIGARWYNKGFRAQGGEEDTVRYLSPRDDNGHGSHTSSTAAGSVVTGVSQEGLAGGIARGGAPGAQLAAYKACWNDICSDADVLKAMDDAIHDGVGVLSLSIGDTVPFFPDIHPHNGIGVGAFHAVTKGIPVVCAGGNDGPTGQTVTNTAPWIITVAASTVDRAFPTLITLGNNQTFWGQGLYVGDGIGFTGIYFDEGAGLDIYSSGMCSGLKTNEITMAGKVALCFSTSGIAYSYTVSDNGGLGVIVSTTSTASITVTNCADVPCIFVDNQIGTQILHYFRSSRSPRVKISPSKTLVGNTVSVKIAGFSSRGPGSMVPEILKPDIAAPGVNVLAAWPPENATMEPGYALSSGTSMACPHVAGVVALLRSLHPSWSPAAIKSALITTASIVDSSGEPIYAQGSTEKIADPFDYGGGIVNPNNAANPGLVYDMGVPDYIQYLCSTGYNNSVISRLTKDDIKCPKKKMSLLDLNLPSFTIPRLHGTVAVTRTVTNVGPANSVYHASVEAPMGVRVEVVPHTLIFSSAVKKITFTVIFNSSHKVQRGYYFGSLSWSDGERIARSPISVKTERFPLFADLS